MANTRNLGRYGRRSEYTVPGDLPKQGPAGKAHIVYGYVDDPNPAMAEDGKKRREQKVAVNANTDVLEREYKWGNISTDAYVAGRAILRVMGSTAGDLIANTMEPVDGKGDRDAAMVCRLDDARYVVKAREDIDQAIGKNRRIVLEAVILHRQSFEDVAACMAPPHGVPPSRLRRFAAAYWRESIEDLGKALPNIRGLS